MEVIFIFSEKNKISSLLLVLILLIPFSFVFSVRSEAEKDVAIYTGPGAYAQGVTYLTEFLSKNGYSYVGIDESDILNGILDRVKILIMPGGWAGDVDEYGNKGYGSMKQEAKNRIKDFIKKGGSYYGICAGAYFVSKYVIWENEFFVGNIDVFNGTAIGPIEEIAEWPYSNWTTVLVMSEMGLDFSETLALYWGGPIFVSNGTNFTVLERYGVNNKPASIVFNFLNGKVILTGIHHEWPKFQNETITEQNIEILQKFMSLLIGVEGDQGAFGIGSLILILGVLLILVVASTVKILLKRK